MINTICFIFAFVLFLCPARVGAQEEPVDAAWLLTLDTIKAESSRLMTQNTRLNADYHALLEEVDQLNASIEGQGGKNAALADFLKTRHGRSNQQVRIQELERQIKDQRDELKRRQREKGGELDRLRQELKVEKANEAKLEKSQ